MGHCYMDEPLLCLVKPVLNPCDSFTLMSCCGITTVPLIQCIYSVIKLTQSNAELSLTMAEQ